MNIEQTASHLGFFSTRIVTQMMEKWKSTLINEERQLLTDYCTGEEIPNNEDPFPTLFLSPKLDDCMGLFLKNGKSLSLDFFSVTGKVLYKACVLVFNKKILDDKVDTPWRFFLKLDDNVKPEWRVLYKPPLTKRVGDIQWRVLHGAIAVNAFISILNPEVSSECPFCFKRETVFHAFMECSRLNPLFDVLRSLFDAFNETFSKEIFVLGAKYVQKRRIDCQLVNFILGQAKLAIYSSRKKIEQRPGHNVTVFFSTLVKSRVLIDFNFYKSMDDLISFELKWCSKGALCSIFEDELFFTYLL